MAKKMAETEMVDDFQNYQDYLVQIFVTKIRK